MLLAHKLLRELSRAKGQTAAVLAVTGLGVLLFVTSGAAYRDLRDSYARTQRDLRLADLHVKVVALRPTDVSGVARLPGVLEVDARAVAELPVRIGAHRVTLQVLSLPESGQPLLDQVLVLSGRLPKAANEILLEKHLAQHHHLTAGDGVDLDSGGLRRRLSVSGIGESAEYLWVTRGENDIFPDPNSFGVGWMQRGEMRDVAQALETVSPGLPGIAVAAEAGSSNELLVDFTSRKDAPGGTAAVKALIGPASVLDATLANQLPGIRLLEMDVDGYKQMAAFFPVFFLGVAAFILASILARLVDAQRSLVGTFAALGIGRGRILGHYLSFALVLSLTGAVLGGLGSMVVAPAMTRAYAEGLGIPFVTTRPHWDLVGEGLLAALAAGLLAGLLPAFRASGLLPAEAMRPPRPRMGRLTKLSRLLGGPLPIRLACRDLLGRPLRSLSTAVGVAGALVLVLASGGLLDSMATTVSSVFEGARHYDLRVDLASPQTLEAVSNRLARMSGVDRVEGLVVAPASLQAGGHTVSALLQGLPADGTLLRSLDLDGRTVDPAAGGLVITRALGRALEVGPGDSVCVRLPPLPGEALFQVTGFADAALGMTATVRLADLQRDFAMGANVTSVVLKAHPGDAAALTSAVSALPEVAHVEDAASLREQLGEVMAFGWVFLAAMLGFSVVLAGAILFNTATIGILERRRELATLQALGRTLREIGVALTVEHAVLAALGLAMGLPLGVWATKQIIAMYSSDLFCLPFVFSARTTVAACTGVVGVLLAAQWPALRALSRTPLADAVREREG